MADLPSHRQLLTTLITSLSEISPASHEPPSSSPSSVNSPLHAISQNHRHLLLTLHVLFPNLLLPAFDLLDRKLVTRLKLCVTTNESGPSLEPGGDAEPGELMTEGGLSDTPDDSAGGLSETFLVKSLATTLTRRHRDVGLSSHRYLVQLGTWNCSCASFTLDAFPSSGTSVIDHGDDGMSQSETEIKLGWSFGGMSLDGLGASGGDVPCCKHLIACLLANKWPSMLESYVEDRQVSKEELAGIIADI